MKDVCAWLVGFVALAFAARYVHQVKQGKVAPALSTWLIFLVGVVLSFITYAVAEKRDFRSGVLNTVDLVSISFIVAGILMWGERNVRFKPFEKWHLAASGVLVLYGVCTGDAWNSNLLAQVLIGIAYFPTWQNLVTRKRNTESWSGWALNLTASALALYPAFADGNKLAAIYACRAVTLIICTMFLMAYYDIRAWKQSK
ncbi:MAG: hypothetical protein HYW65_04115 [Candidatus Liptonbacteria bacterium]|nr:hypothetical protein [Candidatus Liptonbacteria bacterium]